MRIDRFVIEGRLGAGAMGIVYAARDPELDRHVALKLIRSASKVEGLQARLYREAQALARVAHPNVVVVHEVGVHEDQVFLAMELVRGTTLREWLKTPRDLGEILRILVESGRGLAAAHAAELIHRDFKPDNVLIGEDGRARVTDFGLARAKGETFGPEGGYHTGSPVTSPLYAALTQTGMMVGTPVYASPEQLAGQQLGPASDQFAFCITAFEALYGKRPFDAADIHELTARIRERIVAPTGPTRVPKRIYQAILRGLSPAPEQRFPSMNELLVELAPPATGTGKRVWILGGAVIAATGLAAAGIAIGNARSSGGDAAVGATCAEAGKPVTEVWNANISKQLRGTFVDTKSPHADALYRTADAWYTHYANDWSAARQAACTRQGGSAKPDDATRSTIECLDLRLERFKGNIEGHLKDSQTARVPMFLLFLDPIQTCTRDKFEVRSDKFDEVTKMRMEIMGAQKTWLMGAHEQSHKEIDKLLARADAFGYGPLSAEVQLMRAQLASGDRDMPRMEGALRKALTIAEKSADDRSKTIAATTLASVHFGRSQLDEAEHMIDQALATLERFGPDISVESELLVVRGKIAGARKKYDEAVKLLEEAVTVADANSLANANALFALAEVYKAWGKPDEERAVRERIQKAIPIITDKSDPALAAGREQLRLFQQCQVDFESPSTDIEESYKRCRASALEIDRTLGVGSQMSAMTHLMLANMLELLDRAKDAFEEYELAAKGFETLANLEPSANARDGAGRQLYFLKNYTGALEQYEKALAHAKAAGASGVDATAFSTGGSGRALVELGKHGEAIARLEDALERYGKMKNAPLAAMANAKFALAKARWARNAKDDRSEAALDGRLAQRIMKQHRETLKTENDLNRRQRIVVNRRLAEIDAWVAAH